MARWLVPVVEALVFVIFASCGVEPATLHFAVISSSARAFNSSGSLPAVELALRDIQNSSVLPQGYSLAYTVRDSECDDTKALEAFLAEFFHSNVVKIAVIGCGCPTATAAVGLINNNWNVPLISPDSSDVLLSNNDRFQNLWQLFPPTNYLVSSLAALIRQYGWKRVFMITQEENIFYSVSKMVKYKLLLYNITLEELTVSPSEVPSSIPNLFGDLSDDFRIFFLNMYSSLATEVLCEASRRGYRYPNYTLIVYGDYIEEWWRGTECTNEGIETVLNNSLAIQTYPVAPNDHKTDYGLTPSQFLSRYKAALGSYHYTYLSTLVYDSVWTLALALNASMQSIAENDHTGCENEDGNLVAWEDFMYNNSKMGCVLKNALGRTNFHGVSGPVRFDSNGTKINNTIRILQYRKDITGLHFRSVGYVLGESFYYLVGESNTTVFPIIVPFDGTPLNITNGFSTALTAIYYLWSAGGIILCIICLTFNIIFRNRKVIKLTSPNLNYFLITGVFITFATTYVRLYPSIDQQFVISRCIAQNWLNSFGYSLGFGVVLAKMFRVYYIFHNPSPNKKALSDWHLMIIILMTTGICLLVLIIGSAIPAIRTDANLRPDDERSSDTNKYGVKQNYFVWQCYVHSYVSLIMIYVYLAILQVIALVLAIKTRKVKIKTLNDSKAVAALIYISSIILAMLAVLSFSLGAYLNRTAAVYDGGMQLASTMFLLILFVPKMYWLYKDPQGEDIFKKDDTTTNTEAKKTEATELNIRISVLQSKIKELELRLKKFESPPKTSTSNLEMESSNKGGCHGSDYAASQDDGEEKKVGQASATSDVL